MRSLYGTHLSVQVDGFEGVPESHDVELVIGEGSDTRGVLLSPKKARRLARELRKAARQVEKIRKGAR